MQAQFQGLHVHSQNRLHFDAQVEAFTSNTYIMVISSDPEIQPAATSANIRLARKYFEPLLVSHPVS